MNKHCFRWCGSAPTVVSRQVSNKGKNNKKNKKKMAKHIRCVDRLSKSDIEDKANVPDTVRRQVLEDGNEVQQLVVVRVREPAAYRQRVLGVEDVRRGGVVDDDGVFEIPPDLGKVLDVVPLVVVAGLAEEAVMNHIVDIELVQERVAILRAVRQVSKHGNRAPRPHIPWRQKP